MPKFPDILLNNNPDAPSVDLNDLQVKGVGIFADATERDALNSNLHTEGYLAIMKDTNTVFVYTGGTWTDAANWQEAKGVWEEVAYTGQTAIKYENGVVGIKDSAVPYSTNANLLAKAAQFPVDSGSQSSGTLMHLHEGKMIFTTDNSPTGFIGASFLGTTHATTDYGSIGLYNRKAWISGGEGVYLGSGGTAGISTYITGPGTSGQIKIGGQNFDTTGGIQLSGDTGPASNYHKIVMGGQIIFHGHTASKYVAISRRGTYGTDGGVQISGGSRTGLFAHFAASDPNTQGTYGYLGINVNSPQVGGPAFEVSSSYAKFNDGLHIGDITATGYAFPTATGTTGQILKVDANGDLVFGDDIGSPFTSYTGAPPLSNSNASAIEWSPTTTQNTMYLGFDPTTTPFLYGDGSIKMGGRLEATGDVIGLASVRAPQFYNTGSDLKILTIPNTSRVLIGKNAGPNSGTGAILIGQNTGNSLQSGDINNVMMGVEAGRFTEGDYNTFIGNIAGNQRFSSYNTAIGASALRAPSGSVTTDNTGGNNTAVGYQAGINVTTSTGQVFLGYNAGMNSNATNSVVVGSGSESTTGVGSVVVGSLNTSVGNTNVIVGYQTNLNVSGATVSGFHTIVGSLITLNATSTFTSTTIIGKDAAKNGSVVRSIVIGESASQGSSATDSIIIGYQAADDGGTRTNSTIIGVKAATNSYDSGTGFTASASTIIGTYAGYHSKGTENVYIGRSAALSYDQNTGTVQTGSNNVAIGSESGYHLTTSANNVLIGRDAGYNVTTGGNNVFLGSGAGMSYSTVGNIVAIGYNAGNRAETEFNTLIGYSAGEYISNAAGANLGQNTALGHQAMQFQEPSYAIAVGFRALRGGTSDANNAHVLNIAIGNNAMYDVTTAGSNVGVGHSALFDITSGGFNVVLGNGALNGITTGSGNVAVGDKAMRTTAGVAMTGDYNIAIGVESGEDLTTAEHSIYIGKNSSRSGPGWGPIPGIDGTTDYAFVIKPGSKYPTLYGSTTTNILNPMVSPGFMRSINFQREWNNMQVGAVDANQMYYVSGASVAKADASSAATGTGMLVFTLGTNLADDSSVMTGHVNYTISGSFGDKVYLSTTPGALTTTAPTGSGEIVRIVGYISSTNQVYLTPSNDWIEL